MESKLCVRLYTIIAFTDSIGAPNLVQFNTLEFTGGIVNSLFKNDLIWLAVGSSVLLSAYQGIFLTAIIFQHKQVINDIFLRNIRNL